MIRDSTITPLHGTPFVRLFLLLVLACSPASGAQPAGPSFNPSPHAIDIPPWFRETFLDIREDVREAANEGKRLMVYFGQDGCPYCRELMRVNFSQKDIVEKARGHFHAVAINLWGDREVTWLDGSILGEKSLATRLGVQFTPTLLFFDEKGAIVLRLNGYYPPHQLNAAMDYVASRQETRVPFAEYLQRHARAPATGRLHDQPFFLKPPLDLRRPRKEAAHRPLAVLFEQKDCAACDELHREGFASTGMKERVARLDVARLELFGKERVVTPSGRARSFPYRSLPQAVPPRLELRVRDERRLPHAAELPALSAGARGEDPRGRGSSRSLVNSNRRENSRKDIYRRDAESSEIQYEPPSTPRKEKSISYFLFGIAYSMGFLNASSVSVVHFSGFSWRAWRFDYCF